MHHGLVAVEVGRPEPPLQTVTLYNRGPAPVQFELDTAALQDLRAACWDFEVLKLLSPSQGTIPARGHLVTWWSFSPLEAKEYAVTVPVRVDGEPSHNLVVTARGVAPTHVPGRWDAMAEAEGLIAGHRPPPGSLGLLSGEVDPFSGRGAEADAPMPSGDAAGDTGRSRAAGPSAGAEASAAGSPGAARERERERESGPAEMPRALLRTATARPGTKDGLRGPETLGLDERTGENMGSVDLPLFARLRDRASHVALSQDVLDMGSVACAETRCSVLVRAGGRWWRNARGGFDCDGELCGGLRRAGTCKCGHLDGAPFIGVLIAPNRRSPPLAPAARAQPPRAPHSIQVGPRGLRKGQGAGRWALW